MKLEDLHKQLDKECLPIKISEAAKIMGSQYRLSKLLKCSRQGFTKSRSDRLSHQMNARWWRSVVIAQLHSDNWKQWLNDLVDHQ